MTTADHCRWLRPCGEKCRWSRNIPSSSRRHSAESPPAGHREQTESEQTMSAETYSFNNGTVYHADGTVAGTYTTDAAGNIDSVSTDEDGNGAVDTVVADTDHNGSFESAVVDTNADGYGEVVLVDTDNDGDFDTSAVDTNADGTFETTAYDPNGF